MICQWSWHKKSGYNLLELDVTQVQFRNFFVDKLCVNSIEYFPKTKKCIMILYQLPNTNLHTIGHLKDTNVMFGFIESGRKGYGWREKGENISFYLVCVLQ